MARQPRIDVGEHVYHVINRGNGKQKIFTKDKEYKQFEKLLEEAKEDIGMRILAYTIMPNHWHLVLYPEKDGNLSEYMKWLSNTHTRKYHIEHKSIGHGHLYQGRYKSFLVETDSYLAEVCRYVEQNALRAKLVKQAEDWKWSSLWRREKGSMKEKQLLSEWPIEMPRNYLKRVNQMQDEDTLDEIRASIKKGKPYGSADWVLETIEQFDLQYTTKGVGRPRKA